MSMSDPILITLIAAIPTTLTAVAAIISARTHTAVKKVDQQLVAVSVAVNGRLQQLLEATIAQGRQDERDDQRQDTQEAQRRQQCPLGHECPISTERMKNQ